jgi:Flp pilus assembly protein TadG
MTRRTRRNDERGTAGVEAAFAVVALLLVGFFIIGALRVTNTAAHAAARAAAAEYDAASANAAANRVAAGVLSDRGVACQGLNVVVGGDLTSGGVVTVEVTCTVDLSDVALAGFPGSRTLTGRGVEQVDVVRGGG